MNRLALAFLLVPAVAVAGKGERAVEKAGFTKPHLVAEGKLWVVDAIKDGTSHRLLVDPKHGRVIDTGAETGGGLDGAGDTTVTVKRFFGRASLWDVEVSSAWTTGLGGGSSDGHYIVWVKGFTLACSFAGSSSDSVEDAGSASTVKIKKVSSHPLTWTVTTHGEVSRGIVDPDDQVETYELGGSGTCAQR